MRIAAQNFGPFSPGGTVAFVDDNCAESILPVVFGEETGKAFIIVIQTQRLVGRVVNAGILSSVGSILGLDDARVVTERSLEPCVGLLPKLVPIAQEEGWFRKLPSLR